MSNPNKNAVDLVNLIKDKFTMRKDIAPVETSSTASRDYKVGDKFYYGNLLQRATQNIAQGTGLAGGVNFENADPVTTTIQNLSTIISKNGSKNICPFEGTVSKSTSDTAAGMIFYLDLKEGDKITYICNQDNAMTSNTRNSLQVTLNTDSNVAFRESTDTNYHLQSGLHVLQFTVPTTGRYNFSIWAHTLSTVTTYSKFMVCDTDFYDLDPTYEPYAATNRELTVDKVGMDLLSEVGAVNLLNNTAVTQTQTETHFTVNADKSVTVVIDSTTPTPRSINAPITLKAGTYRLSGCPFGGPATIQMTCYSRTDSSNLATDKGSGAVFTINKTHECNVYIDIRSNAPAGTYLFKPMVAPVEYTGPYVPYAKTNKELTELTKVSKKDYISTTYGIGLALKKVGSVIYAQVVGDVIQAIEKNATVYTLPEEARPYDYGLFFWITDQNTMDSSSDGSVQLLTKGYINTNGKVNTGAIANGAKTRSQMFSYIAANDTPLS